jgi:hypothetical protein
MHRYLEIVRVLERVRTNPGSFWSYKVFGSPLPPSPIAFLSCLELTSSPTKVPRALGIIRVRINMIMNRLTMISLHHAKIRDFWEEVNTSGQIMVKEVKYLRGILRELRPATVDGNHKFAELDVTLN